MSFTNLYYKRPTTTVLATAKTTDFVYTCDAHLKDPGFASQIVDTAGGASPSAKAAVNAEEIAKVKADWEERQKRKKEKEEKAKADKDKDKKAGEEKSQADDAKEEPKRNDSKSPTPSMPGSLAIPTVSGTASPAHERYSLHRDYFAMRLAEHRKLKQTKQAKELAPRLPIAPRSTPL
ncbi:hypothetical protein EWM64_g5799 [Hericium alpestre]|uniref:DUF1742-domain-containing protein n=1 Tax=Hericium alpestre TaxID=135208 RepID=A0A4Y9ZVE6_9AGAM|nr:hypothetical protein EWM64_g5799 [Hericium alpestre]